MNECALNEEMGANTKSFSWEHRLSACLPAGVHGGWVVNWGQDDPIRLVYQTACSSNRGRDAVEIAVDRGRLISLDLLGRWQQPRPRGVMALEVPSRTLNIQSSTWG